MNNYIILLLILVSTSPTFSADRRNSFPVWKREQRNTAQINRAKGPKDQKVARLEAQTAAVGRLHDQLSVLRGMIATLKYEYTEVEGLFDHDLKAAVKSGSMAQFARDWNPDSVAHRWAARNRKKRDERLEAQYFFHKYHRTMSEVDERLDCIKRDLQRMVKNSPRELSAAVRAAAEASGRRKLLPPQQQ